ncbi:MAG: thiamine phosphate synthase [Hyphomicrobiaceae bacterium]|nr:thiamine phosphate synthase [Hyphomicrobiaceae bacterium]
MAENQTRAGCELYLIVPPEVTHDMAVHVAEAGSAGTIACALLQCGQDSRIHRDHAEMLLRFTRFAGLPLVFERDIQAAAELGADGVHIPADEDLYHDARKVLGEDAIVGAECGLSRHDALILGELGVDYVAFKGPLNDTANSVEMGLAALVQWWSETVIVPCVAWDTENGCTERRLADAGADFIAKGNSVWAHPEGLPAAMRKLSDMLAEHQASTQ